jgi:NMD protein affecting ribosome stability and mRNA decay
MEVYLNPAKECNIYKPHWVFCEDCGRDVVWDANLSQVCPKCRRATAMG